MLLRDQTTVVTLAAPAKLNLSLQVLGKRPDGYHELETLMVSVDLYDTLRIALDPSGAIALACHDAGRVLPGRSPRELPPADRGNLVLRAAELLRETTGTKLGARLTLIKRIPMAAGLAGGSSDAAAALFGLNHLWRLGLTLAELRDIAARLGSDIPFFLCGATAAICRGRGEIIEPQSLPLGLHFVIAKPPSGLSTAEVFRHCSPSKTAGSAGELADAWRRGRLDEVGRRLHNDLQSPAEQLNDEVTTLKHWFAGRSFAGHLMSGSGTSYFGLCRTRGEALRQAARLKSIRLGDVFVARSRP